MWSYTGTVSQNTTTGNPFVSEQYLQYVTEVVPSASCPRSVLFSDWMQQCSLGTEPDKYQPGAATAFAKCVEIANKEILASPLANPGFVVGFCEIEVVGADTQKRRWYHVKFPGEIFQQQQTLRNETLFDLEVRHWTQEYEHLTLKYWPVNLGEMLRLTKGVDIITRLRLSYQQSFLNRLDSLGDLCHRTTRAISVPTISANRLLPQKSVWSFHASERLEDGSTTMFWQLKLWDHLARDISKQSTRPGLRSGNTVIDERNFALGRGCNIMFLNTSHMLSSMLPQYYVRRESGANVPDDGPSLALLKIDFVNHFKEEPI
ncbi:hypothetical protein G3M48_001624 [Beauveria asiatica]|uniref:Uncharacterized protein n=1 Tax=Beauveria asiatica TaxID=1069075 RepID=A0AAW0RYU3_9HYPO